MRMGTFLRTRVDRSPLVPGLLLGDLAAIVVFAAIGVDHHGGDPLGDPTSVALTAAPFLIGWLLVAFVAGLYTVDAVSSVGRAASWAVPAWIVAALVGQGLRATALFPGNTALTFVLVTILFGGLLLVGFRVVAAAVS